MFDMNLLTKFSHRGALATLLMTLIFSDPFSTMALTKDSIVDPDIRTVNYEHRIHNEVAQKKTASKERMAVQSLPKNSTYASSQAGRIQIIDLDSSDENSPFMQAMISAANIWEKFLRNTTTIRISVKREEMASDILAETYVKYVDCFGTIQPSALARQTMILGKPMPMYDAEIVFNSGLQWYYGTDTNELSGISAVTAMLRCISQVLGMGSTIIYDEYGISMDKPDQKFTYLYGDSMPGPMERLIFNPTTNIKLTDLNIASEAFAAFVQPQSEKGLFCYDSKAEFQLYSPKKFEEAHSLSFFRNPNSLMWYDFQPGDRYFNIDEATLKTVSALGWTTVLDGVDNNFRLSLPQYGDLKYEGIGSAYDQITAIIENCTGKNVSSEQIQIYLFDKQGNRISPASLPGSYNTNGIIFQIENPDNYWITSDGYLKAELLYECMMDGNEYTSVFRMALDMRPVIREITTQLISTGMGRNYRCTVNGDAITDIKVYGVNRQGGESLLKSSVMGSTVILMEVMNDIKALKFVASNKYGNSVSKTVDISTTPGILPDQPTVGAFMIFDEESHLIKSGAIDEYKESYSTLQPGHYIVRYYNEEGFVCAEQIYKAF